MNRLETNVTGGMPYPLETIRFQQSAIEEVIKGLAGHISIPSEVAIITGCVRSTNAGNVTISEGFVILSGEVCYHPEQTYVEPSGQQVEYWQLNEFTPPAGTFVYENGQSHDVWRVRQATIIVSDQSPALVPFSDSKPSIDYIRQKLNNKTWTLFTNPDSDAFYGAGQTPTSALRRYYKDVDGFVKLRGLYIVDDVSPAANLTIGNLPIGFRPQFDERFTISERINQGSANFYSIQIITNGDVRVINISGSHVINLGQIPTFKSV